MRAWGWFLLLAACGSRPVVCKQSSECAGGECRPAGQGEKYCSQADPRCPTPSGHRWGKGAGPLAERCVDVPVADAEPSDDFEAAELAPAWNRWSPDEARVEVAQGELHITPTEHCVWWKRESGPGLYKHVEGDFRATSKVRVRSLKNPDQPPPAKFQFGGLIARDPGALEENWVFAVVGEREGYLALESKNTVDGKSKITAPDWGSQSDAEIRICRLGPRMLLLARKPGGAWEPQGDHRREDFPPVLQVGPIAYAYTEQPDVRASFDRLEIVKIASEAECRAD
jgi:hypothetical protein